MTHPIRCNRTVSVFIILGYFASFLIFVSLPFPLWSYVLIVPLLVASSLFELHKTGAVLLPLGRYERKYSAITQFSWDTHNQWKVWTRDGQVLQVELLPGSAMYLFLVILNFRTLNSQAEQRTFSLLLTEKQLPKHEFRRLRVRLGLQANQTIADSTG